MKLLDPHSLEADGAQVELANPTTGVVLCRIAGPGSAAAAQATLDYLTRVYDEQGRVAVFHDWRDVTSYTTEARAALTGWTQRRDASRIAVTMLVKSRVLAAGVNVARMLLADFPAIESLTDPIAFEAALSRAVSTAAAP